MNHNRVEIERAVSLHSSGRIQEASDIYAGLLKRKPRDPLLLNLFGSACIQLGNVREGVRNLRKCIEIAPNFVAAHNNLGAALIDMGKPEEALFSLRRAVALEPAYPMAQYNLGRSLASCGRHADALRYFDTTLLLMPSHVDAAVCKGLSLLALEQYEAAVGVLEAVAPVRADSCPVLHALGRAYHRLCNYQAAESAYQRALDLNPNHPKVLNDLGLLASDIAGDHDAVELFQRALTVEPDNVEALINFAACLTRLGRLDEAETYLARAQSLRPESDQLLDVWGLLKEKQWSLSEARAMYRRAYEINPKNATVLHHALMLENYFDDEPSVARNLAIHFASVASGGATPYSDWPINTPSTRPLRVGFVSGDLRNHSVGFFLRDFVAELDPQQVFVHFYPTVDAEDAVSEVLKKSARLWRPIGAMCDQQASAAIYADAVDVLFDLAGHTAHNRLSVFAWRPAPVQVSWLGYCATTGMPEIDYYLADQTTLPSSLESQFVETIRRMPGSYLCASIPSSKLEIAELPAERNGYITFGSFNNLAKIGAMVVRVWAEVLNAVPNSRLLLKARALENEAVRRRVTEMFESYGLAGHRIDYFGHAPEAEAHFAKYGEIDIALDPFPYNGVTTTVEALWMGVPVLSVVGNRFLSRQGAGLLSNAGFSEFVASNYEELIAKAVNLAADLPRLSSLRKSLRANLLSSPLMDSRQYARAFEQAIREMYEIKCSTFRT